MTGGGRGENLIPHKKGNAARHRATFPFFISPKRAKPERSGGAKLRVRQSSAKADSRAAEEKLIIPKV
jgi:hypothetical protein